MGKEFGGDVQHFRKESAARLAQILRIPTLPETELTRVVFETFAATLSLVPALRTWSDREKQALSEIIQARSGRSEMRYLHLTQGHDKLRTAFLKLGSKGRRSVHGNCGKIMVSAAGFEPATHALKGHCSTN